MDSIRQMYNRIDDWVWELSRGKYAVLTGFTAAFSSFVVTLALGDPNYAFAVGIGLTLTVLYYWSNPNHKDE